MCGKIRQIEPVGDCRTAFAYPLLSVDGFAMDRSLLPFHPQLLKVCSGSVEIARFLARVFSGSLADIVLPAVEQGRI